MTSSKIDTFDLRNLLPGDGAFGCHLLFEVQPSERLLIGKNHMIGAGTIVDGTPLTEIERNRIGPVAPLMP